MQTPILSLCVCTHNGSDRVEDTLWSLVCQTVSADGNYEIVVVENASDDGAKLREVVDRVSARFAAIELVVEPEVGLSNAKNRALRESRGEYLYFIDDDAIANPRLVEHFLDAIAEHRPDVLGGNVLPLFEVQPPPEMDYRYWSRWSLKHLGGEDRWLGDGEYFLGGNEAVARSVLEANPFDPAMGRRGSLLAGGEEWHLGDARLRRRFVVGAYIFHKVGAERQNVAHLARLMVDARLAGTRRVDASAAPSRVPGSLLLLWEETGLFLRRLGLAARLRIAVRRSAKRRG